MKIVNIIKNIEDDAVKQLEKMAIESYQLASRKEQEKGSEKSFWAFLTAQ